MLSVQCEPLSHFHEQLKEMQILGVKEFTLLLTYAISQRGCRILRADLPIDLAVENCVREQILPGKCLQPETLVFYHEAACGWRFERVAEVFPCAFSQIQQPCSLFLMLGHVLGMT